MSPTVQVVDLRHVPAAERDLSDAVRHLRAREVLGYPTETVYGFGTVCAPGAIARLTALKARPADKPFIVLVRRVEDVADLAWTPSARELAEVFWPGAVTLVLPDPHGRFPEGVRSREGAVAVRMSPHPLVARLLDELGEPVTSTSANAQGRKPARSGRAAAAAAGAGGGSGEVLVLDVGSLPPSGPSTVVDCTRGEPVVVRPGTVPVDRLRCVLPEIHGR